MLIFFTVCVILMTITLLEEGWWVKLFYKKLFTVWWCSYIEQTTVSKTHICWAGMVEWWVVTLVVRLVRWIPNPTHLTTKEGVREREQERLLALEYFYKWNCSLVSYKFIKYGSHLQLASLWLVALVSCKKEW